MVSCVETSFLFYEVPVMRSFKLICGLALVFGLSAVARADDEALEVVARQQAVGALAPVAAPVGSVVGERAAVFFLGSMYASRTPSELPRTMYVVAATR